jgi:hypothetical protein
VLLDRGGDARVLALRQRVIFPHQALGLGELADHFGQEIGLGKQRRGLRLLDIGADQRRQLGGQSGNPFNAIGLRAELLVEHDVLELRQALFELCLQIGLVEELRIREPRADHAPVAGNDRLAAVGGFGVRREDEAVGKAPGLRIAQHEAFLVDADGGADHLVGNLRNDSSNSPISTTGHSTSPATSLSNASSSTSSKPCAKARFLASVTMISLRRAGSSTTLAFSSDAT